jgi:hypothetical protein
VRARAERKRPGAAGGCFEFDSNAGFVLLLFVFHTLARRQPRRRAGQALCLLFGVVPLKVTSRTACQHALANLWGHQLHHHCRISAATSDAHETVHFLPVHQLFAPLHQADFMHCKVLSPGEELLDLGDSLPTEILEFRNMTFGIMCKDDDWH